MIAEAKSKENLVTKEMLAKSLMHTTRIKVCMKRCKEESFPKTLQPGKKQYQHSGLGTIKEEQESHSTFYSNEPDACKEGMVLNQLVNL